MDSLDQAINGKNLDDLMYQRMKNRERQRRYRERKRLQAETTNRASSKILSTNSPAETSNKVSNEHITRVHCTRDWKKDARRAHAVKQEVTSSGLSCHPFSPTGENQGSYFTGGVKAAEQCSNGEGSSATHPGMDTREMDRSKPGRRDWKAEARNKKL